MPGRLVSDDTERTFNDVNLQRVASRTSQNGWRRSRDLKARRVDGAADHSVQPIGPASAATWRNAPAAAIKTSLANTSNTHSWRPEATFDHSRASSIIRVPSDKQAPLSQSAAVMQIAKGDPG